MVLPLAAAQLAEVLARGDAREAGRLGVAPGAPEPVDGAPEPAAAAERAGFDLSAVGPSGAGYVWAPPKDSADIQWQLLTPPNPCVCGSC
jgi:hypothetical protein